MALSATALHRNIDVNPGFISDLRPIERVRLIRARFETGSARYGRQHMCLRLLFCSFLARYRVQTLEGAEPLRPLGILKDRPFPRSRPQRVTIRSLVNVHTQDQLLAAWGRRPVRCNSGKGDRRCEFIGWCLRGKL